MGSSNNNGNGTPLKIGITFDATNPADRKRGRKKDAISSTSILSTVVLVEDVLKRAGHEMVRIGVEYPMRNLVRRLEQSQVDAIFNLCEGVSDNSLLEISVAGLYELLGLPYTGNDPIALGLCLNKAKTKALLSYMNIPTPKHVILDADMAEWKDQIPFPVIVKPSREDASIGISSESVVRDVEALRARVQFIVQKYEQPAIVEQFIEGREFNVTVIGNDPPVVFPLSEIDFSGLPGDLPHIVSYEAKWVEKSAEYKGTVPRCPAPLEPDQFRKLERLAQKAYKILGCRDYARLDVRMGADGKFYVLEVNPNPDVSDDAGLIRSVKAYGWTYDQFVLRVIGFALDRRKNGKHAATPEPAKAGA